MEEGYPERDGWRHGDVLDPATGDVAPGEEVIFFDSEDWGGVNLGEASSLGDVSNNVDRDTRTFDLIATAFLCIPRGMLVAIDRLTSG